MYIYIHDDDDIDDYDDDDDGDDDDCVYIYIYIYVCVCVRCIEREREIAMIACVYQSIFPLQQECSSTTKQVAGQVLRISMNGIGVLAFRWFPTIPPKDCKFDDIRWKIMDKSVLKGTFGQANPNLTLV